MRLDGRYFWYAFVALGVFTPGCGEELGPERYATTTVSGVIRIRGVPIRGGWVEFLPVDGTIGKLRSAPIREDGSFNADGVGVGNHSIGLMGSAIPAPYRGLYNPLGSILRRRIAPGPSTTLKIDLYEEALRAQDAKARGG